jgi:hypothetical protein
MRGPIDFIVVGFEGNNFDGSILQTLKDALESGVIALVGLAFISKDEQGTVTTLDITDIGDDYLVELSQKYGVSDEQIGEDDIEEVADLLNENTSAGLLVIEHLWAKPLKKAIIDAGGVLVADGRIHPDAAAELED